VFPFLSPLPHPADYHCCNTVHTKTGHHCSLGLECRPKNTAGLLLSPPSREPYCCLVLSVPQTPVSGMRALMCFCLMTLLHFKVVPSRDQDDCSDYVKPLSFQGKLQYAFTYYQYLSPACSTSISECTIGGTICCKRKLTGLTGSCKNKGTIGQTVCWERDWTL
jgi:hypothetical protein